MRKLTVLILVGLVVWGFGSAAQEPVSFAAYLPPDTPLYVSLRTSDAVLDDLEQRLSSLSTETLFSSLGGGIALNLSQVLDLLTISTWGGRFDETVGTWLGDEIALGLTSLAPDDASEGAVFVDVDNHDAARTFITTYVTSEGTWSQSEDRGFSVFVNNADQNVIALGTNMLVFASRYELVPFGGAPASNLGSNPDFNAALDLLPADGYNAVAYADLAEFGRAIFQEMGLNLEGREIVERVALPAAAGAAILGDRSFAVDVAVQSGNLRRLRQRRSAPIWDVQPVSAAFLQNLPAGSDLVVYSSDLNASFVYGVTVARNMLGRETDQQIAAFLEQLDQLSTTTMNLNFRDDVIGWMTGRYALYLDYAVPEPGTPSIFTRGVFPDALAPFNLELGLVVEATAPEQASALVNGVEQLFTMLGMAVTQETVGGASAVVISVTDPTLSAPVEILVGANDRVLVIGTRASATAILQGEGGLDSAGLFVEAWRTVLDNPTMVWYAAPDGLIALGDAGAPNSAAIQTLLNVDVLDETADSVRLTDLLTQRQQDIRQFAGYLDSATISTAYNADGNFLARLVITLAK